MEGLFWQGALFGGIVLFWEYLNVLLLLCRGLSVFLAANNRARTVVLSV